MQTEDTTRHCHTLTYSIKRMLNLLNNLMQEVIGTNWSLAVAELATHSLHILSCSRGTVTLTVFESSTGKTTSKRRKIEYNWIKTLETTEPP